MIFCLIFRLINFTLTCEFDIVLTVTSLKILKKNKTGLKQFLKRLKKYDYFPKKERVIEKKPQELRMLSTVTLNSQVREAIL